MAALNPKFRKLVRRVKRAVPESLMGSIDWSRYSVDGWLVQYGNWVNDRDERGVASGCPMFRQVQSHKKVKSKKELIDEACNITDDEARAIMRIILDMRQSADKDSRARASALIDTYEYRMSMRVAAARQGISTIDLRLYLAEAKGYIAGRMGLGEQRHDTNMVAA